MSCYPSDGAVVKRLMDTAWIFLSVIVDKHKTAGTFLHIEVIVDYSMQVKSFMLPKAQESNTIYFRFSIILADVNDLAIVGKASVVLYY